MSLVNGQTRRRPGPGDPEQTSFELGATCASVYATAIRQSIEQLALASWLAMLSAAAESVACLSAIEGELSMIQRKSTFTARAVPAPRSSATMSAATTRAPVDLVIGFIGLLLPAAAWRGRAYR